MNIVMVSGKQGAGKSTLCDALAEILGENCYRTRFAKALYAMHDAAMAAAREFDVPVEAKEGVFLQLTGTEWGRVVKGENVWVNTCRADCLKNLKGRAALIDDLRFPNEFHAFDDMNVVKIRLTAPESTRKVRTNSWRDNTNHPSETGLDAYEAEGRFDLLLDTSKLSQEEALAKAVEFLKTRGVI